MYPGTQEVASTLVLANIKRIHARADLLTTSASPSNHWLTVDPAKLRPISRLGDISYGRLGGGFRFPWGDWEMDEREARAAAEKRTE